MIFFLFDFYGEPVLLNICEDKYIQAYSYMDVKQFKLYIQNHDSIKC